MSLSAVYVATVASTTVISSGFPPAIKQIISKFSDKFKKIPKLNI